MNRPKHGSIAPNRNNDINIADIAALAGVAHAAGALLVVDSTWSEPVIRASRNLERAIFSNSSNLNALDLVRTPRVLISEAGLQKVLERTKN